VILVAVVIALVVLLKGKDSTSGEGSSGAGSAANRSRSTRPALPGTAASDPQMEAKFQERKLKGMSKLREDLDRRVLECKLGSAVAHPRRVALTLDWDGNLSTEELQRFVVSDAAIADTEGAVSDDTRRCLQHFVGATLNVLLPQNELPVQHVSETISLPLQ
jgi:hypothetical protein